MAVCCHFVSPTWQCVDPRNVPAGQDLATYCRNIGGFYRTAPLTCDWYDCDADYRDGYGINQGGRGACCIDYGPEYEGWHCFDSTTRPDGLSLSWLECDDLARSFGSLPHTFQGQYTSCYLNPCEGEPPIEPEPSCRAARDDALPAGGARWSRNLLAPIWFGLRALLGARGTAVHQTVNRVRYTSPQDASDPCRKLVAVKPAPDGRGTLRMLADGRVYLRGCTRPAGAAWTFYAGRQVAQQDTHGRRAGYAYWRGVARLPYWTTALYRSHTQLCGNIES